MSSERTEVLPCGSSDAVRARGLDLVPMGREVGSSGVVTLACEEIEVVEAVLLGIV